MADAFVEGLAELLGRANVLDDAVEMAPYLTDWRGRFTGRARAVLRPGSAAELSELVARCHAAGVPMVPQGQYRFVWWRDAACRRRRGGHQPRAPESHPRVRRGQQYPGGRGRLHAGCRAGGCREHRSALPLSLASEGSCQIGGNLSTNAGGVHVLRYGNTRDLVLESRLSCPMVGCGTDCADCARTIPATTSSSCSSAPKAPWDHHCRSAQLFPRPRSSAVAWVQLDSPALAVELLAHFQATAGNALNSFELIGRAALELVLRHMPGPARRSTSPARGQCWSNSRMAVMKWPCGKSWKGRWRSLSTRH